jgi:hypothetical protein
MKDLNQGTNKPANVSIGRKFLIVTLPSWKKPQPKPAQKSEEALNSAHSGPIASRGI